MAINLNLARVIFLNITVIPLYCACPSRIIAAILQTRAGTAGSRHGPRHAGGPGLVPEQVRHDYVFLPLSLTFPWAVNIFSCGKVEGDENQAVTCSPWSAV
jgi:hypothetical protein